MIRRRTRCNPLARGVYTYAEYLAYEPTAG